MELGASQQQRIEFHTTENKPKRPGLKRLDEGTVKAVKQASHKLSGRVQKVSRVERVRDTSVWMSPYSSSVVAESLYFGSPAEAISWFFSF